MAEKQWTKPQTDAINCREGTVLVSAAAGSGKTAVLVQRVIDILIDRENPVDANEILVVTFSNAAAAEMKQRISQHLTELIQQSPNDHYLLRQRSLLTAAHISTVHAFCMDLVRTNFHLLDISPDFRLGSEKEIAILQDEIAEDVIETYYENNDGQFSDLVELVSSSRDDKALTKALHTVYKFLRSHPFYQDWMDSKLLMYDTSIPVEDTAWGQVILNYAKDSIDYAISILRKAIELIQQDDEMGTAYLPSFENELGQIENVAIQIQQGTWDDIYNALRLVQPVKLKSLPRGYSDNERKEQVQNLRKSAHKIVEDLCAKQFCSDADGFCEDIRFLLPKITTLFELVKAYDKKLLEEKRQCHMIDFSDLEHYAIELLVENQRGHKKKTPLAESLTQKYKYVLVDEYQDTNETQDLIFQSLSKADNLFMVGDVKQSIYRFRQAMPEIFIQKRNTFRNFDGEHFPARIILSNNFRSRQEVTDSINFIFHAIMSQEVGEIDYDESEKLVASASYPEPENKNTITELHFIENVDEELSNELAEANYVAEKIEALLDSQFPVFDNGKIRPIAPRDICILLRTHKNKAELFTKSLSERGIHAWTDSGSGFLELVEISTCISILRAIDNPLIDIHLTAAMMSPVFGFSADEMALIRIHNRNNHLYLNCCEIASIEDKQQYPELWEHCNSFVEAMAEFRLLSSTYPAHRLLQKLIDRTGLWEMASAMKYGEARKANLRLLINYAAEYESRGYKGISGFLRFIDRMVERGDDFAGASAVSNEGDAIHIMSIHRSKGLEFPVVFLCDTSKAFNKQDLRSNLLLHSQLGFACTVRDFDSRIQCTTVPLEALRLELERASLSEEMRVLYVAMTRAKEKLIVTAIEKKKKDMGNISYTSRNTISPYIVRKATSYADWIKMSLYDHPDAKELREKMNGKEVEYSRFFESRFKIVFAQNTPKLEDGQEEKFEIGQADPNRLAQIKQTIDWKYIDEDACILPSKLSVSEITKDPDSFITLATQEVPTVSTLFEKTPAFLKNQELTAAQKGTALHNYMTYADHQNAVLDIEKEILRLVEYRFLTAKEAESLNRSAIAAYYQSELFARVNASSWVKKEFAFMMDLGKDDLEKIAPNIGEHFITVQGIADLLFQEKDGLVLVDFKTDNVTSPEKLVARYAKQLNLYAKMIEYVVGLPIHQKLLYSFRQNAEILVG